MSIGFCLLIAVTVLSAVWHISKRDPLYLLIVGALWLRAVLTLWCKVAVWSWVKFRQELRTEIQEHELEVLTGRKRSEAL